jgi:hypothetical protein
MDYLAVLLVAGVVLAVWLGLLTFKVWCLGRDVESLILGVEVLDAVNGKLLSFEGESVKLAVLEEVRRVDEWKRGGGGSKYRRD